MSVYIIVGILVSLLIMAYIWLVNKEASDGMKFALTLAVATTGWMAWPGYLIAGIALLFRNISQRKADV